MLVAETDCYWLSLLVETGCDWFKLVRADCWNCLWLVWFMLVETGCEVQTGCWLLKLVETRSNQLLLVVHDKKDGCDQFKLVLADCWNWLWLVQTGSCWLLKLAVTSSNWFLLIVLADETGWNKVKPVVKQERWWLWPVQTIVSCWLLKLAVTSSNWFMLFVETGCD